MALYFRGNTERMWLGAPQDFASPLEQDRLAAIQQALGAGYEQHPMFESLKNADISSDLVSLFPGSSFNGTPWKMGATGARDLGKPNAVASAWIPKGFTAWFCRANGTWCTAPIKGPRFVFEGDINRELIANNAKEKAWALNQTITINDDRTQTERETQRSTSATEEMLRQKEYQTAAAEQLAKLDQRYQKSGAAESITRWQVEQSEREAASRSAAEREAALQQQQTQAQLAMQRQQYAQQVQAAQPSPLKRYALPAAAAVAVVVAAVAFKSARRRA